VRHKWHNTGMEFGFLARKGTPCQREGCPWRQRYSEIPRCDGRRGTVYREEWSQDGGITWAPLKELGGRVPPCGGPKP
jgi:hypothetical protein